MLRGIGAVTFDLDGTLADLGPAKARLWREVLRAPRVLLGWAKAVDRVRGQRHPDPRAAAVQSLARELALPEARVDAIVARAVDRRFPRLYRHVPALAGTVRLLETARAQRIPVAVVSDYPALEKLDALGLPFDIVIDCNALGALKPLPDGLLAAARQVGVPPCRLLHVGDRWDTDGLAAAAAGTNFVPVELLS
jgi:beta-phosphoglucomutase-like phosphatase (HAD superfamily)